MKQLHAPWRMDYIRRPDKGGGCFLCDAASAPGERWPELLVVYRDEVSVALLNRYPYNNGHLLVAPLEHEGDLDALSPRVRAALLETVCRMEKALKEVMRPHGFNIGLNIGAEAGAGVPGHLHFHIVPRWRADTNFMPVTAGVKVIPQALSEARAALAKALEAEG